MFESLDRQTALTTNQKKIVVAAIIGDMLEFFDYFLIGFVLAFIIGPWKLTFGQSAVILLSSGIGAALGAFFWGWLADKIGRRKVFLATIINFSVATGALAFTPDNGWIYLTIFRFIVGFGVGGLYAVDLPLVQEFVPARLRGFIGGLVTCFIPVGILLGSVLGAFLAPTVGWRGLFALGVLPAFATLLVRLWVPESPRWLMRMGRTNEARESLAWALEKPVSEIDLPSTTTPEPMPRFSEIFKYPRSLLVSWLGNLGGQTGYYGVVLWAPTLLVLLLKIPPAQASYLMIFVTLGGLVGRIAFSLLSEWIGRRAAGGLLGFGAAAMLVIAGLGHDVMLGTVSLFWLMLIAWAFFGDGGFAVIGPYSAEVWPVGLRTTGMGAAYGFGGIGKTLGPLGLALIIGSDNFVKPDASVAAIPTAFIYFAGWYLLAGIVYSVFGLETKGRSFEAIEVTLEDEASAKSQAAKTSLVR